MIKREWRGKARTEAGLAKQLKVGVDARQGKPVLGESRCKVEEFKTRRGPKHG
jgi:hypothetical protein